MSVIRCIYHPKNGMPQPPAFPATDQHPTAVRYLVGLYYVDALDGPPTQTEIDALLAPPTQAQIEADALGALNGGASRIDTQKLIKATVISDLAFRLGKTPGTLTATDLQNERNRIAAIYKAL